MWRRHSIKPRRVIFIGVEGRSDRAFVQFLGLCCEQQGRHLHLDVTVCPGGDSVAVVECAVCHLSKPAAGEEFSEKLVLLDRDRIPQDTKARRNACALAKEHGLKVVFQVPNLEGLLFRLCQGREQHQSQTKNAKAKLKKLLPEYHKGSLTKEQLAQRFKLVALQRAARHDQHLQNLLAILEIAESS